MNHYQIIGWGLIFGSVFGLGMFCARIIDTVSAFRARHRNTMHISSGVSAEEFQKTVDWHIREALEK